MALLGENQTRLENYVCRNDLENETKKRTGSKDRGEMSELRASVRHEEEEMSGQCDRTRNKIRDLIITSNEKRS